MFGKGNKQELDHVLMSYRDLVATFASAIIANPGYEFRNQDKRRYFDELNQEFTPNWKYELTMLEARRYADAFMAMED